MTALATIFDDAFLREVDRYTVSLNIGPTYFVQKDGEFESERSFATQEECRCFVFSRAREAGFAALREAVIREYLPISHDPGIVLESFLASLAGGGEAGKGEG